MRRFLASLAVAASVMVPAATLTPPTMVQGQVAQDGLVNLFLNDVLQVENVNVAAVVTAVANICPGITADVAALASQVDQSGESQTIDCTATADRIRIAQNNPSPSPEPSPGPTRQDGLVNVYANDLIDVQNVNVAAVVAVIANVCPGITADVAALASQVDQSGESQTINCTATGAPITISQNNARPQDSPGGQGRPSSPPGQVEQDGLVNVVATDLIDVRDVNVAAVVGVIANVCPGITADVAALASQVDQTGESQTITCTATGKPIEITQNLPGRGR